MPDVFISYSRRDADFTNRLHSALAARNRDVWVDWEDIPVTAHWWKEICDGIEAADTFLFVTSPDSIASPICNLEVAYAIRHHKRLVPIIRREVDEKVAFAVLAARELDEDARDWLNDREILAVARDNWQALARHNWLLFQDDTEFEHNFERLIDAMDTDLDYTRMHTRLLVRAREWETRGRERSFLLSGTEIREAEVFLAESVTKQPPPTDLQSDYILASQRAEAAKRVKDLRLQCSNRRRLQLLIALLVVFTLLMLGSFYWTYAVLNKTVDQITGDELRKWVGVAQARIDYEAFAELVREVEPDDKGRTEDERYWNHLRELASLKDLDSRFDYYTYTRGAEPNTIVFIGDGMMLDDNPGDFLFKERLIFQMEEDESRMPTQDIAVHLERHIDAEGTWVSAYGPISDSTGQPVGWVGVDMPAAQYLILVRSVSSVFETIIVIVMVAFIIGVIVFSVFHLHQRRSIRLENEYEARIYMD